MSYAQIDYRRLRDLLDDGAQLVEVLPEAEYAEEHLPGAVNVPLKQLDGLPPNRGNSSRLHEVERATDGTRGEGRRVA